MKKVGGPIRRRDEIVALPSLCGVEHEVLASDPICFRVERSPWLRRVHQQYRYRIADARSSLRADRAWATSVPSWPRPTSCCAQPTPCCATSTTSGIPASTTNGHTSSPTLGAGWPSCASSAMCPGRPRQLSPLEPEVNRGLPLPRAQNGAARTGSQLATHSCANQPLLGRSYNRADTASLYLRQPGGHNNGARGIAVAAGHRQAAKLSGRQLETRPVGYSLKRAGREQQRCPASTLGSQNARCVVASHWRRRSVFSRSPCGTYNSFRLQRHRLKVIHLEDCDGCSLSKNHEPRCGSGSLWRNNLTIWSVDTLPDRCLMSVTVCRSQPESTLKQSHAHHQHFRAAYW